MPNVQIMKPILLCNILGTGHSAHFAAKIWASPVSLYSLACHYKVNYYYISHRMETWHTISQNEAHLYFHLTCKDHKLLGKTVRMLTKYMIIAEMHLSPTHSHNGNKHSVIKTF